MAVAVVAIAAASLAPAALGATIRVNDDAVPAACVGAFPTIQQGVNAASPGDTVLVCRGTYNENVHVNVPNLTIRGQNLPPDLNTCRALRTPIGPNTHATVTGAGGAVFVLAADNITLQSLVIRNGVVGVATSDSFSGHRILQNLIQDNGVGLVFGSAGTHPSQANANCFRENNGAGVGIGGMVQLINALVQGNRFFGHTQIAAAFPSGIDMLTVQGNIANNNASGFAIAHSTGSSIVGNIVQTPTLASGQALCVGPLNDGLLVQGNIFKGALGWGIRFHTMDCGNAGGASTNLRIVGNIVSSQRTAFYVQVNNRLQNSTIQSNSFSSTNGDGIYIRGATGNGGNTFTANIAKGFHHGCHDETTGAGTGGTANTWNGNIGKPANFPGPICFPNTQTVVAHPAAY